MSGKKAADSYSPEGPPDEGDRLAVSLKTLTERLDASRSSVRRWLQEAGIRPIAMSNGSKGAIRYHWREVQAWLQSRETVQ
jgi:predicted site-specific integrase-resolvase